MPEWCGIRRLARMDITGLVLAARDSHGPGGPHALRTTAQGTPWLEIACAALRDAGCREVIVVVGAQADAALAMVPRGALPMVADNWRDGRSAPLRAGLAAAATSSTDAALVTLVNTPDQTAATCRRVIEAGVDDPRGTLARAHYGGTPGYPVLVGRDHWGDVAATVVDEMDISDFLATHLTVEVDCTGMGTGEIVDD